mgnify:CR=1 FL=1
MKEEVGYAVKQVSDEEHKELSPQWVYEIFEENYMNKMPYFTIDSCHFKQLLSVNSSDPGSLANAVSIKMLDNAILSNESLGVGLAKMMENSVYPNLGSNIDVSV